MTLQTQPYKGARDFYPEDKEVLNYIFGIWRDVARSYGYEEYDAPLLEPIEIYLAKTSEEIVNEQAYVFEDRGKRKVTIRPEMTPSVSRMVAARRQELAYPLRWFSIPNLWRYERPQKGRLREHWQLNVDIFGVDSIAAEFEVISIADQIMKRFGASPEAYIIRLNSRQLVNAMLKDYLSIDTESIANTIRIIDKKDKLDEQAFYNTLSEQIGDKSDELIRLLNIRDINNLPDQLKNSEAAHRLNELMEMLVNNEVINIQFDLSLMRGFDYYTDIVFELYDTDPGNNRALFGGGRYDGLVGAFGVDPVATVGFGMGDVTMRDFLITHQLLPENASPVDICILPIGNVFDGVESVARKLRDSGLSVAIDYTDRKMEKRLKSAVKARYINVLFIGEQELEAGTYKLKNLLTGTETEVSLEQIVKK